MFGFKRKGAARAKVFGLGLSRTGTTSLNRALRQLGYRCKSYDAELLAKWTAGDKEALFRVTELYDAFDDWPFPLAFADLMDRYGAAARYVLTVRQSPQVWLTSYIGHADRKGAATAPARQMAYGFSHPRGHEAEHLAFYAEHNAAVRAAVQLRGLQSCFVEVSWEHGDGWAQLCGLTGDAVPVGPFPHANKSSQP